MGNIIEYRTIRREMRRKTALVGIVTFLIGSIFPIVMTILFLVEYMPEIKAWTFRVDHYGDLYIGVDLGLLLTYWLMIPIPLTIAAVLGKWWLYQQKTSAICFTPVIACGISFVFGLIMFFVAT